MTALHEVHSFVAKLVNLSGSGKTANLNLKCRNGRAVINLELNLDDPPPPPHPSYHQERRPFMHPSPSCLRWSARRAQARAETVSAKSSPTVNPAEKAAVVKVASSKDVKVLNAQVHCKSQNPVEQAAHFHTADQPEIYNTVIIPRFVKHECLFLAIENQ